MAVGCRNHRHPTAIPSQADDDLGFLALALALRELLHDLLEHLGGIILAALRALAGLAGLLLLLHLLNALHDLVQDAHRASAAHHAHYAA
jgi:hypothetical protein